MQWNIQSKVLGVQELIEKEETERRDKIEDGLRGEVQGLKRNEI